MLRTVIQKSGEGQPPAEAPVTPNTAMQKLQAQALQLTCKGNF